MQYKNPSCLIGAALALGALTLPALAQNSAPATDMSNMMYGSYNTGLSSADQQTLTQALGGLSFSDQVMLREKMYTMLPSQNRVLLQALAAPGAVQDGKVQWGTVMAAAMPTTTMPGDAPLTAIMEPRYAPSNKMKSDDMSMSNKMPGMMPDKGMANSDMSSSSKHHRHRRHGKQQDDTTTTQTDTTQGTAPATGTSTTTTPPTAGTQ